MAILKVAVNGIKITRTLKEVLRRSGNLQNKEKRKINQNVSE